MALILFAALSLYSAVFLLGSLITMFAHRNGGIFRSTDLQL